MIQFNVLKDPQADLDYSIDWTAWLGGDTIATSTWSAPGASGITVHDGSLNGSATKTTVWLSGGIPASSPYRIVNHITTAAARADDRSLIVTVAEK